MPAMWAPHQRQRRHRPLQGRQSRRAVVIRHAFVITLSAFVLTARFALVSFRALQTAPGEVLREEAGRSVSELAALRKSREKAVPMAATLARGASSWTSIAPMVGSSSASSPSRSTQSQPAGTRSVRVRGSVRDPNRRRSRREWRSAARSQA
jgi:hypothetical protein